MFQIKINNLVLLSILMLITSCTKQMQKFQSIKHHALRAFSSNSGPLGAVTFCQRQKFAIGVGNGVVAPGLCVHGLVLAGLGPVTLAYSEYLKGETGVGLYIPGLNASIFLNGNEVTLEDSGEKLKFIKLGAVFYPDPLLNGSKIYFQNNEAYLESGLSRMVFVLDSVVGKYLLQRTEVKFGNSLSPWTVQMTMMRNQFGVSKIQDAYNHVVALEYENGQLKKISGPTAIDKIDLEIEGELKSASVLGPNGNTLTTHYNYNDYGQLISISQAGSPVEAVEWKRDSAGIVTSVLMNDLAGKPVADVKYKSCGDSNNEVTISTPFGSQSHLSFKQFGEHLQLSQASSTGNSRSVTYHYNTLNQLLSVVDSKGIGTNYTYFAGTGAVQKMNSAKTGMLLFEATLVPNSKSPILVKTTKSLGGSLTIFTYDHLRVSKIQSGSKILNFTYSADSSGVMTQCVTGTGVTGSPCSKTDANGLPLEASSYGYSQVFNHDNGMYIGGSENLTGSMNQFVYNANLQLTSSSSGPTPSKNTSYTYTSAGAVKSVNQENGSFASSYSVNYDNLGRLTSSRSTVAGITNTSAQSWDTSGREVTTSVNEMALNTSTQYALPLALEPICK